MDTCSDHEYDLIFDKTVRSFAQEGKEIDRSFWSEPVFFTAIFSRMHGILEQGVETSTVPPTLTSSIAHCGPGNFIMAAAELVHPGECMNNICLQHNQCYASTASVSECAFSQRTEHCDLDFFAGYDTCQETDCNSNCRITGALARALRDLPEVSTCE